MNYKVPSYGEDPEISGTISNAALAEKQVGHKWNPPKPGYVAPPDHPMDYKVPNFGAKDQDILDFEVALAAAEKMHKHKFVLPHVPKPKWGEIGNWFLTWEGYKAEKQTEQRILEEKVRQGDASEETAEKLQKVKKEAILEMNQLSGSA
jgi:hypothetical protein